MPKQVNPGNSVVNAVESAALLFGVRSYRLNSRTFTVPGAGGRMRPMFTAQWVDQYGERHTSGMPDLLLTPKIRVAIPKALVHVPMNTAAQTIPEYVEVCVALWVECKYGKGKLSKEQKLFRDDAIAAGAFYIEAHDSADAVIDWFEKHDVRR